MTIEQTVSSKTVTKRPKAMQLISFLGVCVRVDYTHTITHLYGRTCKLKFVGFLVAEAAAQALQHQIPKFLQNGKCWPVSQNQSNSHF